jgi:hypothetical protein
MMYLFDKASQIRLGNGGLAQVFRNLTALDVSDGAGLLPQLLLPLRTTTGSHSFDTHTKVSKKERITSYTVKLPCKA